MDSERTLRDRNAIRDELTSLPSSLITGQISDRVADCLDVSIAKRRYIADAKRGPKPFVLDPGRSDVEMPVGGPRDPPRAGVYIFEGI